MSRWISSLQELVTVTVEADDPTLLQRACAALDMILAEYNDTDTKHFLDAQ